jgi:hypothetical protein
MNTLASKWAVLLDSRDWLDPGVGRLSTRQSANALMTSDRNFTRTSPLGTNLRVQRLSKRLSDYESVKQVLVAWVGYITFWPSQSAIS